MDATSATNETAQRRASTIAFLNFAHALDHFVILIFPTIVIGLEGIFARSYAELIALGTTTFVAFGVFSLPAGWLADRWSRRNMMAIFYLGCGLSLAAAGLSTNLWTLAIALFALGMFAAIYHPVGMPMLIETAARRGRTLAFNGVCGNLGAALAAAISAALTYYVGWRAAFFAPALVCIATFVAFVMIVPDDRHRTGSRGDAAEVQFNRRIAVALFALFIVLWIAGGLIFNTVSVALPKIVDERIGRDVSLLIVGGLTTGIFLCGALAQITVGRLTERYHLHVLFIVIACLELIGILLAAYASGLALLIALAIAMAAIYGQVTVSDLMVARYTADSWRGRAYAVRYFMTFITSGLGVGAIAFFHARGGFDLVLMVISGIAAILLTTALTMTLLVAGRGRSAQPAE